MAFKTPSSDAVRKAGANGYAPGSERILAGVPAWPMLWPLVSFAAAALVIGWPWLLGRSPSHGTPRRHSSLRSNFWPRASRRPIAVLVAFRFQRSSSDRRPSGDDFSPRRSWCCLCSPPPPACGRSMRRFWPWCFLGGAALMLWFRDQRWHWAGGLSPRLPSATAPPWPGASSTSARC